MVLSRFWYLILAVLAAGCFYAVSLAVGQYNRRLDTSMQDGLKADTQIVNWALQIDSRRRLDSLLLGSVDEGIRKSLRGAAGKEAIPPASRDDGHKALASLNEHLPVDYKFDALFAVDRDGRILAASGYDDFARAPEMELGGYPAVFDALHGYSRDDTWVWGGKLARISARPVEDEIGQAPIGAIVGIMWVDQKFAAELAKRTQVDIAFYADNARVASGVTGDSLDTTQLEVLGPEIAKLGEDASYMQSGRSGVRFTADGRIGALYAKIPGDGILAGAGFAVARPKVQIAGAMGFLSGADDRDKASVKLWLIMLLAFAGVLIGLVFTFLEHSRPLSELRRQALGLRQGVQRAFQLQRLSSVYRTVGLDVNQGVERLLEQGGGASRKPADLEAILGPVPVQPQMSAFSFPQADPSIVGFPIAQAGGPNVPFVPPSMPGGGGTALTATYASGSNGPPMISPPAAKPPPLGMRPPVPQGMPPHPTGLQSGMTQSLNGPGQAPAARPTAPLRVPSTPAGGTGLGAGALGALAGAPIARTLASRVSADDDPTTLGVSPLANHGDFGGIPSLNEPEDDDEGATKVGKAPKDVIAASSQTDPTHDIPADWRGVFDEFVQTKKQCGESAEGLTFEKFTLTLKKNCDALIARHNCTRVKFTVYVKDSRASLKATPIRD